jgi:hypothetical protein
MLKLKVKLTLTEQMLGTKPGDPEIYAEFIRNKEEGEPSAKADEIRNAEQLAEDVEEEVRTGSTWFHKQDGCPGIYDYMIKGFFKDSCRALSNADDTHSHKIKRFKDPGFIKLIDGLIFVTPRFIKIQMPNGTTTAFLERPLRAQTPQGERVALARSETVPAGSVMELEITALKSEMVNGQTRVSIEELIREWFNYGSLRGLGQWRNASWGRFSAEIA